MITKPTILIVDDSHVMCRFLGIFLAQRFDVMSYTSSVQALALIKDGFSPDLIVTDLNMPGLNGIELIKALRLALPQVPILVVSGIKESSERIKSLKAGADDFLMKPFHPAELDVRVSKLIEKGALPVRIHHRVRLFLGELMRASVFILALFLVSNITAQTNIELDSTTAKTIRLRPLSVLTDLAVQNSPSIQANVIDVARQTLTHKVQKNSWTDLVNIQGMTMYGNGSLLDAADNGTATRYVLSDRKSLNTNISIGFRVSAGDLVTRGTKAEIQKVQVERLKAERGMIEQHLKEVILVLYTQLESSLKKISIKAEAVENQKITLAIAEKYFKEGNFQPSEYSTILAKVSNAEEQYEDIKAETKKLQLMLKNLVNAPIFEKQ